MTKVLLETAAQGGVPNGFAQLDGNSGLLVPAYAELANLGAAPAAPAAGKTRLYVDSNGLLQLVPATGGVNRRIAAHWGSGTAFPAGPAAGDTFLRTDVGSNGTLYQFTGNTGNGSAGWIAEGVVICTSTTRPTSALYAGLQMLETDTLIDWQWTGTAWIAVGGYTPGIRATKAGTQAVSTAWVLITWDTPVATVVNGGMFSATNPSRLMAPIRGRYRALCVINGPSNIQIRYNAAGSPTGGTMHGGAVVNAVGGQLNAGVDEITLNAGDYLEAFGYAVSATNMGSQGGYTPWWSLSYIGPA